MELQDIVRKLVGPIEAVGETNADERRLANLKQMTELVDRLLFDIHGAAASKTRPEASMRAIGEYASKYLQEIKEA